MLQRPRSASIKLILCAFAFGLTSGPINIGPALAKPGKTGPAIQVFPGAVPIAAPAGEEKDAPAADVPGTSVPTAAAKDAAQDTAATTEQPIDEIEQSAIKANEELKATAGASEPESKTYEELQAEEQEKKEHAEQNAYQHYEQANKYYSAWELNL